MVAPKKQPGAKVDDRPQRGLVVLPGGLPATPVPPPTWLKGTKDEWAAFFTSDQARALDGATLPGVFRLFEMRDLQSRSWARYKKQPYLDGSRGQPVANPAFDEAMALERAIIALEDRYGVSLKALANLGVAVGQAQITAAELNRMANTNDAIEVDGWEEA